MSGLNSGEARVTILVPARNRVDLTRACLASVVEHTGVAYNLVLINAGSDPAESSAMRTLADAHHAHILRLDGPASFSRSNNEAASRFDATPYLCLLNNDTEVTPGWLESLLAVADRIPDLGALGNRHLFPDTGLMHHCGIAFDADGDPIHLHPHAPGNLGAAAIERDVPAVTFACALIPRSVWNRLGGLETGFRNGCEDVDFCLRASKAGYRVVYTPASTIFHHGQASPGRTDADEANLALLRTRHADRERDSLLRLTRSGEQWAAHADSRFRTGLPGKEGPEVHLSIDFSTANAFCWAGAELAIALDARGARVSIPVQTLDASLPRRLRSGLGRMRRRRPGRDVQVKFSHYWTNHLNRSLQGDVNIELFCSNFYWDPTQHRDLWAENVLLNGYRKAPVSTFNTDVLRRLGIPERDMLPVPLGYAPEIDALYPNGLPPCAGKGPLNLFAVTNCADPQRYGADLLLDALEEAFGDSPDVHLHIRDYGAWSGRSPLQEAYAARRLPPVTWHLQFLPKQDFLRLHEGMDLLVAPFRGEGFGMKVADALATGLPVLMPPCGGPADLAVGGGVVPLRFRECPMGPCYDRTHYPVGDGATWFEPDRDHLVEQLRWALVHREELRALGREGMAYVRQAFSWDRSAAALLTAITRWQQRRATTVCLRRRPTGPGVTVVIPTHHRNDRLEKTLAAYAGQQDPGEPADFVIVNDGGPEEPVNALARAFSPALAIDLLHNPTALGPAASRNRALADPRREHVLITGDDIVPDPGFLREHLAAHRRHSHARHAVLGLTQWHPDVPQGWFTDLLTGPGGAQFNYEGLKHGNQAPFDRFYTSNVSVKWSLVAEEENLFSSCYSAAAYEDIELGYRLAQRGMKLYFCESAVAGHLHPQDLDSFLNRQILAGRMLTVFAKQRPCFMPIEHASFLHMLEQLRVQTPRKAAPGMDLNPYALLREIVAWLKEMGTIEHAADEAPSEGCGEYAGVLAAWIHDGRHYTWQGAHTLALRIGMAEEWAQDGPLRHWALAWTTCATLPGMFGMPDLHPPLASGSNHFGGVLLPNSRLAYEFSKRVREAPVIGRAVRRFELSRAGIAAREWLLRHLRR